MIELWWLTWKLNRWVWLNIIEVVQKNDLVGQFFGGGWVNALSAVTP